MTSPSPGPDHEGFSDSDQAWWDRLGGPASSGLAGSAAEQEAELLRRALALQAREADDDPVLAALTTPQAREQRWQHFRERLRQQEERTAQQRKIQAQASGQRRRLLWGGALAASLALTVVLVQRPREEQDYDAPPTMRGEFERFRIVAPQPRQAAETLVAQLRQAGATPGLYQSGQVFSVDLVVAADTPPAALALIRARGAQALPGYVRLEFSAR